jgi:hypothetical protein
MKSMKKLIPLLLVAACTKSGMGEAVRTDITQRMESARPTISDCYKNALRENRKLKGMMVLAFTAAPQTGAFQSIEVTRDDLGSQPLQKCVVDAVGLLKLATPQKTAVSVEYPLDFAPTK